MQKGQQKKEGYHLALCSPVAVAPVVMGVEMVAVWEFHNRRYRDRSTTFNIGIKPKDPPYFHGRANEDVDTWIAKVGDFLYLTEANSCQQVAYAATLLQEAAADWWVALLRERSGSRPADWAEFTSAAVQTFWQLHSR